MTTAAENAILTQTGPGTLLGNLFREYWMPALKSSELKADGEPVRFRLLSENLIAFRDTNGRVGIMDHRCPHRCASLFFGRNEEGGIRCVYHGWKFDVEGKCLDMANVPPHQDFKHKVHAKAYKTAERNGLVWVYMGVKQDAPPPMPDLEATLVPEEDMQILFILRESNWLQGAEGELDTSHLGFLHFGLVDKSAYTEGALESHVVQNRAPEYMYKETDYGTMYAAYRPGEPGETYWRQGHFLWPMWTMPPICNIDNNILLRGYVPVDDHNTMMVYLMHKDAVLPGARTARKDIVGTGGWNFKPNTTDWLGRFRLEDNKTNDYNIDRETQRTKSYTGITGINLQDQAMCESMGSILDRTEEHLAPSDVMITRTRRHIVRAAQAFAEKGVLPKSALDPSVYRDVRGGQFVTKEGADWVQSYQDKVANAPLKSPIKMAAE
jgi:phthalate 4,5-dioxygenase oxygenase subunit